MFCPRCGQQQASGDLRFCSRCGLPLGVVSEVLANGGTLPQLFELQNKKNQLTKANGAKFSLVWFLFWCILATPVLAILGGEEIVALSAVLGFVGALFILIFSLMFLKSDSKYKLSDFAQQENLAAAQFRGNQNLSGNQQQNALPPQNAQAEHNYISPTAGIWKAPDTGELAGPGSVTEGTTKLLNKDE